MEEVQEIKVIRSFQDHLRYLSPIATIHTPGNFGLSYKTTMHAYFSYFMQDYNKVLLLRTIAPYDIMRLRERDIPDLDQSAWNNRVEIMHQVVLHKFLSNETFASFLLYREGEYDFVFENKVHDNFWGDCICGNRADCRAMGSNHYGNILSSVRDEIIEKLEAVPTLKEVFPRLHKIIQDREKRSEDNEGRNIYKRQ